MKIHMTGAGFGPGWIGPAGSILNFEEIYNNLNFYLLGAAVRKPARTGKTVFTLSDWAQEAMRLGRFGHVTPHWSGPGRPRTKVSAALVRCARPSVPQSTTGVETAECLCPLPVQQLLARVCARSASLGTQNGTALSAQRSEPQQRRFCLRTPAKNAASDPFKESKD